MTKQSITTVWWFRSLICLTIAGIACAGLRATVLTGAAGPETDLPAWSQPSVMAIKRVSGVTGAQRESNFLNNLDCSLITYRLAASSTMQTGCFTVTAYGLFDSDNDILIFNGTDEAVPLLPFSNQQALVPWPGALPLVALDATVTGGSYISLYKNPLAVTQDKHNLLLQLTAKQLMAAPGLDLVSPSGQRLIVNAQTLAFSDGGSWLIVETLNGAFVRINLATLDMTAFAPAYGSQGSPALLKSRVAVSDNGRYVAIANDIAASFKVYDLATCGGVANNLQPQNCQTYDYWPFARGQIAGLSSIRHLRFINDHLLNFEATTSNPATGGIYELAPTASITSLIDYLGLGDSYTSGEGAYNYIADSDSAANMCHLSAHSYPLLLTHDLFSSSGGHSVACSGAVINDVGSTSENYRGQVRDVLNFKQLSDTQPALLASIMTNFAPGYVAQQRFVKQYQPGVITVSVGGDDIGFGDIVLNCVMPHISRHLSDSDCYSTYEDRLELTQLIDRTVPRWTALYKQLLASSPGSRIYAIGYPRLAADTGNCAANAHLGKSELELSEELIVHLNSAIKQAADKAGVSYVDISQALAGHRLCEVPSYDVAVNGLTAGTDGGPLGVKIFGKESYHPTALGQTLIEQTILQKTHNLTTTPAPASETSKTVADILNAPKSGRTIHAVVPDSNLVAKAVKPAKSTALQASGSRNGLKPHTSYTVRLDGSTGTVIMTVRSDDVGDISTSIILPADTPPGGHTIDITGEGQGNDPIDVTQPIYVPVSDTDSDGDGIDNTLDSCPTAINSGQDEDRDGLDDSCDGFIGPAATNPPASPASGVSSSSQPPAPTGTIASYPSLTPVGQLNFPATTVVGHFAGTGTQTISPRSNVLGSQTLNPSAVTPHRAPVSQIRTLPSTPDSTTQVHPFGHRIDWWKWAIAASTTWLIWLILVLLIIINRLANRTQRTEYIAGAGVVQ